MQMEAGSGKPVRRRTRAYHSPRRTQAATETRATILATARRLFVERGYGKVTVNDIAAESALAVPTIYACTGGKSAILATIIDEAVHDPIVEETLSAIRQAGSAHDVIRMTAHGTRVDNERYRDVVGVMTTAASIDESAAAILVESDRQYRQALSHIGRRLRDLDALKPGLTQKRANDTLWFYFGREAWHLLVTDRHWSWNDAEQWLGQQASSALINQE
jgi:AcrR family transcriptional regulator